MSNIPALLTHNIFVGDSCSTQFAFAQVMLHMQAWTKAIASRRVHSARCVSHAAHHSHSDWRCQCVAPSLQFGSRAFSRHGRSRDNAIFLHSTIA